MKKKLFIVFISIIFLFSGCSTNKSNKLKNKTSYLNNEDIAEQKTLNEINENLQASLRLTRTAAVNKGKRYYNEDYKFSFYYPKAYLSSPQENNNSELALWLSFSESQKSKSDLPAFYLKIINKPLPEAVASFKKKEEIAQEKNVNLENKIGIKLFGVESGRQFFLIALNDLKTLELEIFSPNMEETFDNIISSLQFNIN